MASLGFSVPPDLSDKTAWSDQLAQGTPVVQGCASCGLLRWPARHLCQRCLSGESTWQPVTGAGTVEAYVVYLESFDRRHTDVPYAVGLVRLDEGVRTFGRLLDVGVGDVTAGDRVLAEIVHDPETGHRLDFRRAAPAETGGDQHA